MDKNKQGAMEQYRNQHLVECVATHEGVFQNRDAHLNWSM